MNTSASALIASLITALTLLTGCAAVSESGRDASPSESASVDEIDLIQIELKRLEEEYDARVGLQVIDTGTGERHAFRADERFGFASSIKALAVAVLLHQTSAEERSQRMMWTKSDVEEAGYSPVTELHVADGMTLDELAEATVRFSDNTALNVLLEYLGGPAAVQQKLREAGDPTTVLTDYEPELNDTVPGNPANTTTPAAFGILLAAAVEGTWLSEDDAEKLITWMTGNATGDALIRASAPEGWTVSDKSGGAGAKRNDIAVVYPPGEDPLVITILTEKNDPEVDYEDALVADVARVVFDASR
ncbi:class A beta-lactamase [Microbacterium sp. NPDC089695]|uniref:class A beta-lactamase n=1 Tax=Microbacterium sp. NPDC089695 TaxID=3364198 RepID=UPI00380A1FDF